MPHARVPNSGVSALNSTSPYFEVKRAHAGVVCYYVSVYELIHCALSIETARRSACTRESNPEVNLPPGPDRDLLEALLEPPSGREPGKELEREFGLSTHIITLEERLKVIAKDLVQLRGTRYRGKA